MTRSRAPTGTPREPRPICSRFVVSLTKPRPSKLEGERLLGTHHEAQRTNLTSASLDSHGHGTIVASHGRYRDGVEEGAGHVKRQALIPIRRCTHTPSERDPSLQTQTILKQRPSLHETQDVLKSDRPKDLPRPAAARGVCVSWCCPRSSLHLP